MIKKVLLIAAFIIFAVSCAGSPTDSTQGGNDSGNTGQNKNFPELEYISGRDEVLVLTLGQYNFESGSVGTDFQSTPKDYNLIPKMANTIVTVTGLTFDSSDTASKNIGLVKEDFTITFDDMVVLSKNGVDKMKTQLKDGEYSKVKLQVKFSLEGYNDLTVNDLVAQCIRENTGK